MQTLFKIIVLFYYLSMLAELYWLAVPSPVSTYNTLKNKSTNKFYAGIISAIAFCAFTAPFLNLIFSFFKFDLLQLTAYVWLVLISIIIIITGRIFTFWGTINIRKHLKKQNRSILKTGAFSISRHPIAIGLIISLIGFNLAYLNVFLFLFSIIFIINIHYKILKEEELLLQQHPIDYPQYIQKNRRYL